jgi:hypothetical protein
LQFADQETLTSGTFLATLIGTNATFVRIDFSTNLVDWLPVSALTNFSGQAVITDPQANRAPSRLYRATVIP